MSFVLDNSAKGKEDLMVSTKKADDEPTGMSLSRYRTHSDDANHAPFKVDSRTRAS